MGEDDRDPAAWRLICAVDATGVHVISRRRVRMTTPPSDPVEDVGERTGFWVEVRDARERVQYRRVMESPVDDDVEVPGDPGTGALTRQPVSRRRTFALLVPDLEQGDHVALLRATPVPGAAARARRTEIARLPLRATAPDDRGPGESTDDDE